MSGLKIFLSCRTLLSKSVQMFDIFFSKEMVHCDVSSTGYPENLKTLDHNCYAHAVSLEIFLFILFGPGKVR